MNKSFLFALVLVASLSGCLKGSEGAEQNCNYDACAVVAPTSEIQSVQTYLTDNNITATQHCSGAFYIIDAAGTGATPNICSFINASYVGKLTNGTVFDQGTFQQPLQLGQLVRGWINTIPLIKQGGKIRLYLPPSLGYGSQANGPIPANSILIFDLELTLVQ